MCLQSRVKEDRVALTSGSREFTDLRLSTESAIVNLANYTAVSSADTTVADAVSTAGDVVIAVPYGGGRVVQGAADPGRDHLSWADRLPVELVADRVPR